VRARQFSRWIRVAHYESAGRKQALSDFSSGKAPFRDRDLYVVCIGPDHHISAHGAFPQFVGVSPDVLKDATGKPLGAAILDSVGAKGQGSLSFMMTNPTSGKTEPKVMWTRKVGEDVCGVGAYKPA
jgi:hypothetical protein